MGFLPQVYRLPLRATVLRWEKMRGLTGLAPTCKDKLGCWVHRNRCVSVSRLTLVRRRVELISRLCSRRLVYFGGYGYIAQPGHRGTFELDENSFMVSVCSSADVTRDETLSVWCFSGQSRGPRLEQSHTHSGPGHVVVEPADHKGA